MNNNAYYITAKQSKKYLGVEDKILTHIQFFCKYYNIQRLEIPENYLQRKYLFKFPFFSSGRNYKYVLQQIQNPLFIYIRKLPFEKNFIIFLEDIKIKFPNCKILLELPTYPYDYDEYDIWYNYFMLKKDQKYRCLLYGNIDRIITYSKDKLIFGCKTLNVANGIDCTRIKQVTNYKLNSKSIRLIAVASLLKHHGYERLIQGLADYYKNDRIIKVYFDIIGNGPEYKNYSRLIKEANLTAYIKMYGTVNPLDLINFYDQADIAISSLGFFKANIHFSSNLKNRDYMARGLPIVCCCPDDCFMNNPFVCYVDNNNTNISIETIIDFYNKIYEKGKEYVINEIRRIALDNVDISSTYKSVLEFIRK